MSIKTAGEIQTQINLKPATDRLDNSTLSASISLLGSLPTKEARFR